MSKQSSNPFPPPAQMQQLLTMPPSLSCRVTRKAEQCDVVNYELNLEVDAKCCVAQSLGAPSISHKATQYNYRRPGQGHRAWCKHTTANTLSNKGREGTTCNHRMTGQRVEEEINFAIRRSAIARAPAFGIVTMCVKVLKIIIDN